MNGTVSNFFSRDALLKRQARTIRSRKAGSSIRSQPLHIIPEEDEPRASCSSTRSHSRSPSPMASTSTSTSLKSKRRHANVTTSDIRLARDAPVHDANDLYSPAIASLLTAPRPAPRPPTAATPSPTPSPDPFSLTFTDVSFKFPHPPLPTPSSSERYTCVSPAPSMSSSGSSPGSETMGLPMTPGSSDDECSFILPSPRMNPRRVAIKPLVIVKQQSSPDDSPRAFSSTNALLEQPCKASPSPSTPLSPLLSSSSSSSSSEYDSDPESDSEWYTREFSKILTLCSPLPSSCTPARRESVVIGARPESLVLAPAPPPRTSAPVEGPNGQLDPAFPRRRRSKRIPKHPPPPVPPIPAHLRHLSVSSPVSPGFLTPPGPASARTSSLRRPPPRGTVPDDCVFDDDACSAFSFSLYVDPDAEEEASGRTSATSSGSFYSQGSFAGVYAFPSERSSPSSSSRSSPIRSTTSSPHTDSPFPQDVSPSDSDSLFDIDMEVEMDYPLMLPLSLPNSPIDLEKDIQTGLEELRRGGEGSVTGAILRVVEEEEEERVEEPTQVQEVEEEEERHPYAEAYPLHAADVFSSPLSPFSPCSPYPPSFPTSPTPYYTSSPTPSSFSFSTTSSKNAKESFSHAPYPPSRPAPPEDKALKSKWSSSTLGSIHNEHAQRQAGKGGKLRLWSSGSPSKRTFSSSAGKGKPLPQTPTTPSSPFLSPRKSKYTHARGASNGDVMVIGYGTLRRSTSVSASSDTGSEMSYESGSSSGGGLRRKPIPVEMFLRSATAA